MKKWNMYGRLFFILLLLLANVIPIYVLLSAFTSPYGIVLAMVMPLYAKHFLGLAVIDIIAISLFIWRYRAHGIFTLIAYAALIFPAFYIYLSFTSFIAMQSLSPLPITQQEALKQIRSCNVDSLQRRSGEKEVRMSLADSGYIDNGRLSGREYAIVNSNFPMLLKTARAVQDRCGYEFDNFIAGVEGFEAEYHSIYITVNQAAKLLNRCMLKRVVYGNPAAGWEGISGVPTGIMLWSKEKPWEIWLKENLKQKTLPTFCEAKKKCPNLYIACDVKQ